MVDERDDNSHEGLTGFDVEQWLQEHEDEIPKPLDGPSIAEQYIKLVGLPADLDVAKQIPSFSSSEPRLRPEAYKPPAGLVDDEQREGWLAASDGAKKAKQQARAEQVDREQQIVDAVGVLAILQARMEAAQLAEAEATHTDRLWNRWLVSLTLLASVGALIVAICSAVRA